MGFNQSQKQLRERLKGHTSPVQSSSDPSEQLLNAILLDLNPWITEPGCGGHKIRLSSAFQNCNKDWTLLNVKYCSGLHGLRERFIHSLRQNGVKLVAREK